MSVRYVAATDGWRKWFRWLRVRYRPYRAEFMACFGKFSQRSRNDVIWARRRLGEKWANKDRRLAWEAKVRDYPHGIAESYIGGPLVIP